jgi:hypothetical protein
MTGVWISLVQLTREAAPDPEWPAAAFVNLVGPAQDRQSFRQAVEAYASGLGYRVDTWEGEPEPVSTRFPRFPKGVRDRHTKRAIKAAEASGEMQSASWHEWEADDE